MVSVVSDPRRPLLEEPPFSLESADRAPRLLDELNAAFVRHYRDCEPFQRICDASKWSVSALPARLEDLPFLPAQYFKEAGSKLVSVPRDKVYRTLASSATSGRPSTVVLDQATARRQAKAVVSVLSEFIGKQRRFMLVCDVPPGTMQSGEISARAAATLGFMTFASGHRHVLRPTEAGQIEIDEAALQEAVAALKPNEPVTLIGFTFLLYTALLEPLQRQGKSFRLPPGSTILHIGGWKKLIDRKVDRTQLAKAAFATFGVTADRVVDCYGFTEQMGTVYAECADGRKHAPAFADVIVRDPRTLGPVADGVVGIGQFLSLVPESYPGFSVLTDDLVRVLGRDDCACGRLGTTFEVLGRDSRAEIRGCGDVIAEKISFGGGSASSAAAAAPSAQRPEDKEIRAQVLFAKGVSYHRFGAETKRPQLASWSETEQQLRAAQKALEELSVDEIVGAFHEASREWARSDGPFAPYHPQGLSFLVSFIQGGGLQRMLDTSLRGGRGVLDAFHPDHIGSRRLRALPRGLVAHWLAGNVPTLGIISLMLSLATKNANVLKVPEAVSPLLTELLASLAGVSGTSASGVPVSKLVTDAVLAVWFPRSSPDGYLVSEMADVRVVWGGAEAVKAVAALPRRWDGDDVVFGPKLSFAAVGREALSTESAARRLARGLAIDCSVFDQEACASAHTVFVEKGAPVSPQQFAAILANQMEQTQMRIPPGIMGAPTAEAIKRARMQHFVDGQVFAPLGLDWTVLYRDQEERPGPVYGRTVFVRPMDDLHGAAAFIDRGTQVVGLALSGPRRLSVAEAFARAGVDRITEPGAMAEFAAPWDGMFPIERFVRWVSLDR
jgi:acyl-protein synthetase LuxE/acyl-CoA reductase LuxC